MFFGLFGAVDFGVNSGDFGVGILGFLGRRFWGFGAIDFGLNSGDFWVRTLGFWGL